VLVCVFGFDKRPRVLNPIAARNWPDCLPIEFPESRLEMFIWKIKKQRDVWQILLEDSLGHPRKQTTSPVVRVDHPVDWLRGLVCRLADLQPKRDERLNTDEFLT
jgi:hypothetical protein